MLDNITIKSSDVSSSYNFNNKPLFMAIGTFDGVHIGHQAIMKSIIERSKAENGVSAVYTFHPHPTFVTHPQSPKPMIISRTKKYKIIKNIGIDVIIEQNFDKNFSEKSPAEFVEFLKKIFPTLSCIFVGSNFRFGHHGSGNTDALSALCSENNIAVVIVPTVMLDGKRASSTRIRQAVTDGDLTKVERMLGRKYHDNTL